MYLYIFKVYVMYCILCIIYYVLRVTCPPPETTVFGPRGQRHSLCFYPSSRDAKDGPDFNANAAMSAVTEP